jgi:hypothetical protein
MKRIILAVALLASTAAFAQQHGHWAYRNGGWGWMAPVVVGGVVGYELASRPPVVVQQPVVIQQNTVVNDQNCSPWTQIQNPDGSITTTRTCR